MSNVDPETWNDMEPHKIPIGQMWQQTPGRWRVPVCRQQVSLLVIHEVTESG